MKFPLYQISLRNPYGANLGRFFSHAPVVADLSGVFPRQMASILPNTMAFRQKHQPPRRFHGIFKSLFFARKLVPRHPRDVPDMSRRRSYASTPVATLAKRTGAIKFPYWQWPLNSQDGADIFVIGRGGVEGRRRVASESQQLLGDGKQRIRRARKRYNQAATC